MNHTTRVEVRSTRYLFPGRTFDVPLSSTTIQKTCWATVQKAGMLKNITPHTLRHSYATGLLEAGVDTLRHAFRTRFLKGLRRLYAKGELKLEGDSRERVTEMRLAMRLVQRSIEASEKIATAAVESPSAARFLHPSDNRCAILCDDRSMKNLIIATAVILSAAAAAATGFAYPPNQPDTPVVNPQIDFPGFLRAAQRIQKYRDGRRIPLNKFMEFAEDRNTIILDSRSKQNYDRKHIRGAIHLNFSDFTKEDLARVIPSKETRILIYCNNNFTNNSPAFRPKSPMMALNIPTFITLHEYGYKNLYELRDTVDEKSSAIPFSSVLKLQNSSFDDPFLGQAARPSE